MESLNKKVKQFTATRLLSFSSDQQIDVWPWLLPEAAHFLNNTWHSSINDISFIDSIKHTLLEYYSQPGW